MRNPLRRLTKQAASLTPAPIEQAMNGQGMNAQSPFGPGRPLDPAWGYSQRPRWTDYPVGVNINIRNRQAWGRASFDTLRALVDAYDVARMCINHKIDEIRSMEPLFLPADGTPGDVDAALQAARAALAFPDRELPFDAWVAKLLENALRYDATPLYRRRNMNGDIIAYEVIDGTTIFPLIDERGRRPRPPAPAWQQVIKGMPTVEFTTDDIDYLVFRPQPGSPFGLAPLESILLTANTDMRFQWHFLQLFTDGNVPAGFMEVPADTSSPDQVAEWQGYWDAMILGDQAKLHQLVAVPAGTKVTETKPSQFDPTFPEYLMSRTCAAYGVVPQDLGLVKDVNRANGETQVDIQFRVNTLPWVRWVEGILTRYVAALGLPVQVKLDTGRDKEDRLTEANAWKVYIESGVASPDEARMELLGLPVDNERPVPRGFLTSRQGWIPLRSVEAIAGPIDPETLSPADDVPMSTTPFDGTPGLMPDKLPGGAQFKRAPVDPDDPAHPGNEQPVPGTDVETPPVTKSEAGDVEGRERAAFARFRKARARDGRWRDFQFTALTPVAAHRMNDAARAQIRKDTGLVVAAGLAVQAADTGRVLMLQRGLDPDDPASGLWEFPGGHVEDGETPKQAAYREWQEETGCLLPYVPESPDREWVSPDGVYQGFLWVVPDESVCQPGRRGTVTNPDDPDGDTVEAVAWWEPAQLTANPAIRPELAADLPAVLPVLNGDVVKAGDADPKARSWRDKPADSQPQHDYDLRLTDHYAPLITHALTGMFPRRLLRDAIDTAGRMLVKDAASDPFRDAAANYLASHAGDPQTLEQLIRSILADAWQAGAHAAAQQVGGTPVELTVGDVDWGRWEPGNPPAAALASDGQLAVLLEQSGVTVQGVTATTVRELGNAIGDGLLAGDSTDTIAASLSRIVSDPSRAEMIAHTETARAVTQATLDVYGANGIAQWDWVLSAGACPACQTQAAANPHPVTGPDSQPPEHPRCRCAASPVVPT